MKKTILALILLSVLCHYGVQAQDITQNQILDNALASMFQYMELDRVPTGFLLDRAVEAIDIKKFNGTLTNDNYVDLMSFRNTLITLNSAIVNSHASTFDGNLITNSLAESGVVNLGVAAFKYNYISSNALSDNLISFQNNTVTDVYVNGIWQNPYSDAYAFVFTPSVPVIQGSYVTYRFTTNQLFTNLNVSSIEFDNGNGVYQQISIPYEATCSYSAGDKHLRMKLTLTNNTVLESHSMITISAAGGGNQASLFSQIDFEQTISETIDDRQISALVSGKSSHSGNVVKPFIFVEGFDDRVLHMARQLFDSQGSTNDPLLTILKAIINNYGAFDFNWFYSSAPDVIKNNYDVFYVDFSDPDADIRDNASLLQSALEWINSQKVNGAERNVVMGHSMGGLIARYVLCNMEANNLPHQTDYYVSFDSPHMGVNIPLGLQYAFRDIYSLLCGDTPFSGLLSTNIFDPVTSHLMKLYSGPSARQMMYYYVDSNGNITSDDHDDWQDILDSIGFPRGDFGHSIENISIVNGGQYDTNDNCMLDLNLSLGNDPISGGEWTKWFLLLFTHASNLNLSIQAYRNHGDGGVVERASGQYTKKFNWFNTPVAINLFDPTPRTHTSPNPSEQFDCIKSSTLSFGALSKPAGGDSISVSLPNPLPFVPAASALAIPGSDFVSPPLPLTHTPFKAYYYDGSAKDHADIGYNGSHLEWLYSQINCSLSGPRGIVEYGDTFSVNAPADYNSPSWSVSESSSFSLSNNQLTYVGVKNPVRALLITYRNTCTNSKMAKRRTVLTGFPQMIADVQYIGPNSCEVIASCTSTHAHLQPVLDSLAYDGAIRFIWGRKVNGGSIVWSDTTSTRSFVCSAYLGDITHVYMKMYCGPGREDPNPVMVQIDRRPDIPFFFDPQETIVGDFLSLPHYVHVSFPYSFSDNLFVWHNSDYNGTPVAPDNIKIGNQMFPLANTYSLTINGETKTVYCFEFMNSTAAQNALASAQADYLAGNSLILFLMIHIRNGTTTLQTIDYPFIPDDN